MRLRTLHFPIKGCYFYSAQLAYEQNRLFPGQPLTLRPEPTNPYDRYAIQIWCDHPQHPLMLGYVPRTMSQSLSQRLERINPHYNIELKQCRQFGNGVEITVQLELEMTWLPYLFMATSALIARQLQRLKRLRHKHLLHRT